MKAHNASALQLASGDYLAVVRDFALSKAIDLKVLLKDSDIDLEDLINPPQLVPNLIVSHVGINLFNALDDPITSAIEFGLKMTASSHGSLGVAVQCAANLGEGFEILREFYNTRLAAQDVEITETDREIRIRLKIKDEATLSAQAQHYFDISTLITIAMNTYQALKKSEIKGLITVSIDTPKPDNLDLNLLEGVALLFDQPCLEMLTPIAWKNAPLSVANKDMAKAAVEKCESELQRISPSDLVAEIKQLISVRATALPKLDELASHFNLSSATLKRRLAKQSTSYLQIKNEVRLKKAKELMKDRIAIEQIAEQLGFSDASNFTKAFKAWTGQTPKAYREGAKPNAGQPIDSVKL